MKDLIRQATTLDERLFLWINHDLADTGLDGAWLFASKLGEWPIVLVTLLMLWSDGRRRFQRHVLVLLLGLPVLIGATGSIKQLVDRERPVKHFVSQIEDGQLELRLLEAETPRSCSMPSGHTAFAFACMIYGGLGRSWYLLGSVLIAVVIGASRVYVGQHFPADVLVGALLGTAWALCSFFIYRWWMTRSPLREDEGPEAMAMSNGDIRVDRGGTASPLAPALVSAGSPPPGRVELTLIAPVLDEVENLDALVESVRAAFRDRPLVEWRLILVDDGSRDGSAAAILALADRDERIHGVWHPENLGQTSALASGLAAVETPWVATLDADLQNDPADLVGMIAAVGGHDAVVGYRLERHDDWLRRVSSRIANRIRNRMTRDDIRDTGCSLKLFRTAALRSIPLFEGMHRFLPTLLRTYGFSVVEHPVSHHPRLRGQSKYGVRNRAWRSFKDLLAVRWMQSRVIHPVRSDRLTPAARVLPNRRPAAKNQTVVS